MNRKLLITSAIVASLLGLATAAAITFVIWGVATNTIFNVTEMLWPPPQ